MLHITILTVGKTKDKRLADLSKDYLLRLSPYAKIQTLCVKQEPFTSPSQKIQVKKREAERLLAACPQDAFLILLHEQGKSYTSPEFAAQLLSWSQNETQHLVFILGGPLGLNPDLLTKAHTILSLSLLTFPHELAQTILLEQLYRAVTILKCKTYHY